MSWRCTLALCSSNNCAFFFLISPLASSNHISSSPTPLSSLCSFRTTLARLQLNHRQFLLHPGNAPGVSAVVSALVPDGIGIVALANADGIQPALVEITFATARKLLGLDELRPDGSSRPQQSPGYNASATPIKAQRRSGGHTSPKGRTNNVILATPLPQR